MVYASYPSFTVLGEAYYVAITQSVAENGDFRFKIDGNETEYSANWNDDVLDNHITAVGRNAEDTGRIGLREASAVTLGLDGRGAWQYVGSHLGSVDHDSYYPLPVKVAAVDTGSPPQWVDLYINGATTATRLVPTPSGAWFTSPETSIEPVVEYEGQVMFHNAFLNDQGLGETGKWPDGLSITDLAYRVQVIETAAGAGVAVCDPQSAKWLSDGAGLRSWSLAVATRSMRGLNPANPLAQTVAIRADVARQLGLPHP